jgi:CubicO group peptidase (beta-lactamase class C family)
MNPENFASKLRTCSRRRFLAVSGLGLAAPGWLPLWGAETSSAHPFASFDREMTAFMEPRKVPGGALAVVKDRRLVYAKGYGWADREKQVPALPTTVFRIASVSKPITAVAVLKLVQDKKLDLDMEAFPAAGFPLAAGEGKIADPRLRKITLRHLLQHTAGWDRDKSGDPMFRWRSIAREQGVSGPPDPRVVIRHMLGQRLDYDPGTQYAYSNFGYCVLGRVIEQVTGQSYEQAVQERVLHPCGIHKARIGDSLTSPPDETHYYTTETGKVRSVFPGTPELVAAPYGSFSMRVMDAHGGWAVSAAGLARFAAALDDPERCPVLRPETIQMMYAPPPAPAWRNSDGSLKAAYYGCGWMVRPAGTRGGANYWHAGSLPGTNTLLVRRWDGLSWVALFNQRSEDKHLPDDAIDGALHRAAAGVPQWPEADRFGEFEV